jgi:Ca-activated chloride channel homolog
MRPTRITRRIRTFTTVAMVTTLTVVAGCSKDDDTAIVDYDPIPTSQAAPAATEQPREAPVVTEAAAAAETTVAAAQGATASEEDEQAIAAESSESERRVAKRATAPNQSSTPSPDAESIAPPFPATTPTAPGVQSRDPGINPTENADFDPLSTFALDVDTSSYTLSRALVQQGTLPDFSTVRTEEFVNYFDQQYPSPETGKTFALHIDGATAPFLGPNQRIVRVGVQAERVAQADRAPAHLTFVIDTSGSMEEDNKLVLVKDALRVLVDNLRADDQIAIVAFSDDARVVLGPTEARERNRIIRAIDELQPTNSTNAEAGLLLGYELAGQMRADDRGKTGDRRKGDSPAIHRVVLASDGVANVGPDGPEAILQRITTEANNGIDLVTVGVGTGNYNDEMMERLADGGNGFSAYIDAPFEAERLFRDRLVSTLQTVARDAKVQVVFNPREVSSYRLLGFENRAIGDSDFRNDSVDAGEIGAGHSVTALYEVTLSSDGRGDQSIGDVKMRWNDAREGKVRETSAPMKMSRLSSSLDDADPRLGLSVTVAAYAEVLRRGPWSRVTDLGQLATQSRRLESRLAGDVDVMEFVRLVEQAAVLNGH